MIVSICPDKKQTLREESHYSSAQGQALLLASQFQHRPPSGLTLFVMSSIPGLSLDIGLNPFTQGLSRLNLPHCCRNTKVIAVLCHLLYIGLRNTNSGCAAVTLSTGSSPCPVLYILNLPFQIISPCTQSWNYIVYCTMDCGFPGILSCLKALGAHPGDKGEDSGHCLCYAKPWAAI